MGFGHSMGGTALLMAERERPRTFAGLVVFEPIAFPHDPARADGPSMMVAGARRRRAVFASRQEAYDNYAGKPPLDALTPEALRAYVDHGFLDRPDGSVELACQPEQEASIFEGGARQDAFAHLGEVPCPVLVMAGTPDENPPGMVAPAIARRAGRRTAARVPRAHPLRAHAGSRGRRPGGRGLRRRGPAPRLIRGAAGRLPTCRRPRRRRSGPATCDTPGLPSVPCRTRCRPASRRPGSSRSPAARWPSASPASRSCPSRPARTPPRAPSSTGRSSCSWPGSRRSAPRRPPTSDLDRAVEELRDDPDFAHLDLTPEAEAEFVADAHALVDAYLELEDPAAVRAHRAGAPAGGPGRRAAHAGHHRPVGGGRRGRARRHRLQDRPFAAGPVRAGPARGRPLLRLPVRAGARSPAVDHPAHVPAGRDHHRGPADGAVGPLPAQAHRGGLAGHRPRLRDRRLQAPARPAVPAVRVPGLVPGVRGRRRPGRARGAGALRPRTRPAPARRHARAAHRRPP